MKKEKYFVVGAGKSGISAMALLKRLGIEGVLYDENENLDIEKLVEEHPEIEGMEIRNGKFQSSMLYGVTEAVLSPGVPLDSPIALQLKKMNLPIIGEVELAFRKGKGKLVAITGTNGKTTTTTLVGELCALQYPETFVVGNIGYPYADKADEMTDESVSVAEISSFMLETMDTFHANVSAILNITPDHLNRHHTMEEYIAAKENIIKNQTKNDTIVLNYDDIILREFGEDGEIEPQILWFSVKEELKNGCYYKDQKIFFKKNDLKEEVIDVSDLQIIGMHNYENVCAAVCMAKAMNVPLSKIRKGLKEFKGVEHRIEFVRECQGIRFYNDSKGTNPDAAIKAVLAMDRPTILIGGGYDKESEYDEWIESFGDKVKKLVLIGATKKKIAKCAREHGFTNYIFCDTLEEAIDICFAEANRGDAILLSPACASWDMFKNYEERGDLFKEHVMKLL